MMAALGAVAQHYIKFPGFESVPSGLAASITAPGSYGFVALFGLSGILELAAWTESDDKEPGNFGDPLGLNQYNQEMRESWTYQYFAGGQNDEYCPAVSRFV